MDWCLKLRTNYGRGNQNGLLTLGNDETALSPHPVTEEPNQEAKTTKELLALAVNFDDQLDELLTKNTYWRTTRACAWILLSTQDASTKTARRTKVPLSTSETEKRNLVWLLRASRQGTENIEEESKLTQEKHRLPEYCRRLLGPYPIYMPDTTSFAVKLVQHAHKATLHRVVGLTLKTIQRGNI